MFSNKARLVIIALAFTLIAVQTHAFNGKRAGFVLGGGLGFSPVCHWAFDNSNIYWNGVHGETHVGYAGHFLLGSGVDEHNLLVMEVNGSTFSSKVNNKDGNSDFEGLTWYHYYGRTGNTLFTVTGVGVYSFYLESMGDLGYRLGVLFGIGWEYARHWQMGAYVGMGGSSCYGYNIDNYHLSVTITTIAF